MEDTNTTRYAIRTQTATGPRYMSHGPLTTPTLTDARLFDTADDARQAVTTAGWVAYGLVEVSR